MCGTPLCPSRTTCANVWQWSSNAQKSWVITEWFAAVWLRLVSPALGVVTNAHCVGESWDLSSFPVRSSLPISRYMWNICKWLAKYRVGHHFEWQARAPGRQKCNTLCGDGAPCWADWEYKYHHAKDYDVTCPVCSYIGKGANQL